MLRRRTLQRLLAAVEQGRAATSASLQACQTRWRPPTAELPAGFCDRRASSSQASTSQPPRPLRSSNSIQQSRPQGMPSRPGADQSEQSAQRDHRPSGLRHSPPVLPSRAWTKPGTPGPASSSSIPRRSVEPDSTREGARPEGSIFDRYRSPMPMKTYPESGGGDVRSPAPAAEPSTPPRDAASRLSAQPLRQRPRPVPAPPAPATGNFRHRGGYSAEAPVPTAAMFLKNSEISAPIVRLVFPDKEHKVRARTAAVRKGPLAPGCIVLAASSCCYRWQRSPFILTS